MEIILIESCGKITVRDCRESDVFKECRKLLGCITFEFKDIPFVNNSLGNCSSNVRMIIDDNSLYAKKDFNLIASSLYSGGLLNPNGIIAGNVVLVNFDEDGPCDFYAIDRLYVEGFVKNVRDTLIDNSLLDVDYVKCC